MSTYIDLKTDLDLKKVDFVDAEVVHQLRQRLHQKAKLARAYASGAEKDQARADYHAAIDAEGQAWTDLRLKHGLFVEAREALFAHLLDNPTDLATFLGE